MRIFWLCVVAAVVIWPIHSTAATVANKPIELLLSDLLVVMMPVIYMLVASPVKRQQVQSINRKVYSYKLLQALALVFVAYGTTLAAVGLGISGETMRLFSAFKLVKPVAFVFLGVLLGSWTCPLEFLSILGRVYGAIVALTFFCTVTAPEFPFGEWGKTIFEYDLSGYPNSAMSFYACLVPLLLSSVDGSKDKPIKIVGWSLAACSALIIVGSMSRSSTIALILGVSIYLCLTGRTPWLIAFFVAVTVLGVVGFGLFSAFKDTDFVAVLSNRIQQRVERSTESDDPTSGRLELWTLAIELWIERPVFGYMFESFSRYSGEFDTPHQQYLEILHKCGGLGLLIYVAMLVSCLFLTRRLVRLTKPKSPAWYQLHSMTAMMVGLMIGNLTQPNLTFSLTGNMIFLTFGCLCSARAMLSAALTRVPTQQPKSTRPAPVPLPKIAA